MNRFKISKISLTRFLLTNSSNREFNELKKSFLLGCKERKKSVLAATQKQASNKYSSGKSCGRGEVKILIYTSVRSSVSNLITLFTHNILGTMG